MRLCGVRLFAARKSKVAVPDVRAVCIMRARPAAISKCSAGVVGAQGLFTLSPVEHTETPSVCGGGALPSSAGLHMCGTYVSVREERCPLHRRAVLQVRQRVHVQFEGALQCHGATAGGGGCMS